MRLPIAGCVELSMPELTSEFSPQQLIAAQDPHHTRGIRSMEVLEWNAHRAFRLNGPAIADVERMTTRRENKIRNRRNLFSPLYVIGPQLP